MHSASYFEAASGFAPLPFQLAWMEQGEAAPIRTLEAPTGLGKTLATLVGWLWDRRQRPESTPRRLVYQLPLRTLTDQIAEECRAVIERQELAIPVHVLRGGQIDNDDVDALAAEAVIVGTLDQVVSRQLMRGYCCSRWSWPRHFAALNTDVRVVVDETQLQGAHVGGRCRRSSRWANICPSRAIVPLSGGDTSAALTCLQRGRFIRRSKPGALGQ